MIAVEHLPDTYLLALTQATIFCAGWLLVAIILREDRAPALCWGAYGVVESVSYFQVMGVATSVGGPSAASLSLALVSCGFAVIGGDLFINRRAHHLRLWIGIVAAGIALQYAAPLLLDPLAVKTVGYDIFVLLLLGTPWLVFPRGLAREFGRPGLLAMAPFGLFFLYAVIHTLRLIFVPGAIGEAIGHEASADARSLVPLMVSSGMFHLTWFALVVGRQVVKARRSARYDKLTGLLQRSGFEDEARSALALARRLGQHLSVAFIDVDSFKSINDRGGHGAGDRVLSGLAQILRGAVRASDHVGRWGGDEFVLLLPDTDHAGARVLLERLALDVQGSRIPVPGACSPLSVSIGFATWDGDDGDIETLIARADKAMYIAKGAGGHRTVDAASEVPA